MRVTVCLAVYNGEDGLTQALDSVFAQTYRDFDVLVLDDGSTDGTEAILSRYDLRVIKVQNAGLGAGRRKLVEEAEGEFIAFVDHDDIWLPEKLAIQMEQVDSEGADLVHSDVWYVYEDGRKVERNLDFSKEMHAFDHLIPGNKIIASTAVFRRSAMLEAGNFVDDTVRCSDWYGWLIIAPGAKFSHLRQRLVEYKIRESSLANAGYAFFAAQHYLLSEKILPRRDELFAGLPESQKHRYVQMLQRDVGVALSGMGKYRLQQGDKKGALAMHREAIKAAPNVLRVWTRAFKAFLS